MASIDKILIVGAGIGGLTSAAALAQHGFSPELVERDPAWVAVGAGIAIQPNAMRILRWLGMDGSIRAVGAALRRWTFTDEQGEFLCQHDLDGLWGDLGPGVCITRRKLQQVLIAGAGPAPVRLGTSVSALVERDDCVSVAFTDGSVGEYDLVIGADGIHSVVRDLVMGGIMPTFANQIAWRSLVRMRLPGLPGVHFSLGDGCFFGLCSVGDDVTYGFGNVSADRFHDPLEGRLRRLRDRFAYFGPTVADYLARLDRDDQIHCSPIEWIEQSNWRTSRVVLIGDAAHATSPMMGQGGGLAMEDAWVLAETLEAESTIETALQAYEERRRPRVGWVQQQSRALAESFRIPPRDRNPVLRKHGQAMLHERFLPLVANP